MIIRLTDIMANRLDACARTLQGARWDACAPPHAKILLQVRQHARLYSNYPLCTGIPAPAFLPYFRGAQIRADAEVEPGARGGFLYFTVGDALLEKLLRQILARRAASTSAPAPGAAPMPDEDPAAYWQYVTDAVLQADPPAPSAMDRAAEGRAAEDRAAKDPAAAAWRDLALQVVYLAERPQTLRKQKPTLTNRLACLIRQKPFYAHSAPERLLLQALAALTQDLNPNPTPN